MAQSPLHRAFHQHARDLVAFVSARLRCQVTAQDLVQDLFLKISVRGGGGTADVVDARAYIFRMAANLVTDHQRRERRQRALLAEFEALLHEAPKSPSPERQAMAQQEIRALTMAIEQLPSTTRHIFKLNRLEGKTQREIALQLGISQTAIEKHIRRALSRLITRINRPISHRRP
jgi:RNA polymerase sigma factor (sigma-70 family)